MDSVRCVQQSHNMEIRYRNFTGYTRCGIEPNRVGHAPHLYIYREIYQKRVLTYDHEHIFLNRKQNKREIKSKYLKRSYEIHIMLCAQVLTLQYDLGRRTQQSRFDMCEIDSAIA